jgi:hypothetical protein
MKKLHQLEARKLLKELDYVKSDYEYKNEIVFEADNSFMRSLNDFLEKNPVLKEMFEKKSNRSIDDLIRKVPAENIEAVVDECNEVTIVENKVDERLKSIYRSIAKKTHPDKILDTRLNDLYITASSMYESNDIMGIYSICDQLGISYDLSSEDIDSLKSQIAQAKEGIFFMESTFSWKWHHAEDEGEKSRLLVEYIKSKII